MRYTTSMWNVCWRLAPAVRVLNLIALFLLSGCLADADKKAIDDSNSKNQPDTSSNTTSPTVSKATIKSQLLNSQNWTFGYYDCNNFQVSNLGLAVAAIPSTSYCQSWTLNGSGIASTWPQYFEFAIVDPDGQATLSAGTTYHSLCSNKQGNFAIWLLDRDDESGRSDVQIHHVNQGGQSCSSGGSGGSPTPTPTPSPTPTPVPQATFTLKRYVFNGYTSCSTDYDVKLCTSTKNFPQTQLSSIIAIYASCTWSQPTTTSYVIDCRNDSVRWNNSSGYCNDHPTFTGHGGYYQVYPPSQTTDTGTVCGQWNL